MSNRRVAELSVRAMLQRKPSIVPGWRNFFTVFLTRLVPRRMATFPAEWTLRGPSAESAPPASRPPKA